MRKQILTAVAVVPFLLSFSHAAQRWEVESWQPYGIPSEESGSSSYLGIDIADITSDRLGALKLREEKGVEVTMVDQDAPAGKAGIKEHDVILNMNGTVVESKTQLQRMIHETPPGRVVTLGLSRDGVSLTLKVQLADRGKEMHQFGKDFHIEVPPIPNVPAIPTLSDLDIPNIGVVYVHSSVRSGLMVENLTPQLGEFFGAKNGRGVLVRSVEKGSRADRAGLRAGDVITRVGDQPVQDSSDFTQAMHSHGSGGSVRLGVIRDKKEQTLTLTLPERKESGWLEEESSEAPELNAETREEISKVQEEIAKLQPQILLVKEESRKAGEEARKAMCEQQKKMKEQEQKYKLEMHLQLRQELEMNQQKLQRQMEQLRHQMQGDWLDI
jgi:serine protease Do